MAQPPPPKFRRLGWVILALLAAVGLWLTLGQESQAPRQASTAATPEVADKEMQAEPMAPAPDEAVAEEKSPPSSAEAKTQPPAPPRPEDTPRANTLAESDPSDPGDDFSAAKAKRDRQIARSLEAINVGIARARANPGLPPEVVEELQRTPSVPVDIEEAARQVNSTPPEVMEGMRQVRATPPEIAEAIAEAAARGTSDEMRAYMAGETDQRPEY